MRALFALVIAVSASAAQAQIRIQDVPIAFGIAAETKLQAFGPNEVASTTASFSIRNIQATIDAVIPGVNSLLKCGARNPELSFKSITLQQAWTQNAPLTIAADAHVRDCHSIALYQGDVIVSVSANIDRTDRSISLTTGKDPPMVTPAGFVLVGRLPAPNSLVISKTQAMAGPQINRIVDWVNGQIRRGLDAVKRWMTAYAVTITASQLTYRNNDLTVSLQLSGQVPLAIANKWLTSGPSTR